MASRDSGAPGRSAAPDEARGTRTARTDKGEKSRARLLDAAIDLLSERGFAGTSVGDVSRKAGVAKTALYWHFESKEGLLAAVIEEVGGSWIEEIQKSVYLEGAPLDRLDRLVAAWRRLLAEQGHMLRLLLMIQLERSDASAPTREALRGVWQRAEAAIHQGIEDSIPIPMEDVDLVAQTMLTLMNGAMMRQHLDPEGTDLDRVFAEFRRTVVLSLDSRVPPEQRIGVEALKLR